MKAPFRSSPGQTLEKGLIGLIVVIAAGVVLAQLIIYGDFTEQAAAGYHRALTGFRNYLPVKKLLVPSPGQGPG